MHLIKNIKLEFYHISINTCFILCFFSLAFNLYTNNFYEPTLL